MSRECPLEDGDTLMLARSGDAREGGEGRSQSLVGYERAGATPTTPAGRIHARENAADDPERLD